MKLQRQREFHSKTTISFSEIEQQRNAEIPISPVYSKMSPYKFSKQNIELALPMKIHVLTPINLIIIPLLRRFTIFGQENAQNMRR